MANRPQKYAIVNCPRSCSLNASNYKPGVGEMIHGWYEAGHNREKIRAQAIAIGVTLSDGAIARHKKNHLVVTDGRPATARVPKGQRKSDLDILDAFIQRGAQSIDLATFAVTGEQLLKAIDLKQRLTQGSLYEEFYKAIGAVMDESESAQPEAPEAQASEEERAQVATED